MSFFFCSLSLTDSAFQGLSLHLFPVQWSLSESVLAVLKHSSYYYVSLHLNQASWRQSSRWYYLIQAIYPTLGRKSCSNTWEEKDSIYAIYFCVLTLRLSAVLYRPLLHCRVCVCLLLQLSSCCCCVCKSTWGVHLCCDQRDVLEM